MDKLSQLSDQDISKWIAEKLEPLPLPYQRGYAKFWLPAGSIRDDTSVRPRDIVNEPAMTVMVIELMLDEQKDVLEQISRRMLERREADRKAYPYLPRNIQFFFRRAVTEVFMLMHGWTE